MGGVTVDGAVELVVEIQGNGFGLMVFKGDEFGGVGLPPSAPIGKKLLALTLGDRNGHSFEVAFRIV